MNSPSSAGANTPRGTPGARGRKLALAEWAHIAEIISSLVVVISLIAVVYSLERNTTAVNADLFGRFFDAMRDIETAVAANPEYAELVYRGEQDYDSLNPVEKKRYGMFVTAYLDIWEQMWDRRQEGVVDEELAEDWDNYWNTLLGRYLTQNVWQDQMWQYNATFVRHVETTVGLEPSNPE